MGNRSSKKSFDITKVTAGNTNGAFVAGGASTNGTGVFAVSEKTIPENGSVGLSAPIRYIDEPVEDHSSELISRAETALLQSPVRQNGTRQETNGHVLRKEEVGDSQEHERLVEHVKEEQVVSNPTGYKIVESRGDVLTEVPNTTYDENVAPAKIHVAHPSAPPPIPPRPDHVPQDRDACEPAAKLDKPEDVKVIVEKIVEMNKRGNDEIPVVVTHFLPSETTEYAVSEPESDGEPRDKLSLEDITAQQPTSGFGSASNQSFKVTELTNSAADEFLKLHLEESPESASLLRQGSPLIFEPTGGASHYFVKDNEEVVDVICTNEASD